MTPSVGLLAAPEVTKQNVKCINKAHRFSTTSLHKDEAPHSLQWNSPGVIYWTKVYKRDLRLAPQETDPRQRFTWGRVSEASEDRPCKEWEDAELSKRAALGRICSWALELTCEGIEPLDFCIHQLLQELWAVEGDFSPSWVWVASP